jgi:hypothetical protein
VLGYDVEGEDGDLWFVSCGDMSNGKVRLTFKSSWSSSTSVVSVSLGLIRAALKTMTSTSSPLVRASSSFSTLGMDLVSERSMRTESTLALEEDLETNGASSFWRRWRLRARMMMWLMPFVANLAAMCWLRVRWGM